MKKKKESAETLTKLVESWLAKEAAQLRTHAHQQLEDGAPQAAMHTVGMAKAVAACAQRFKSGKWREVLVTVDVKA
jgi:hypothetical protein